ncbi:N-acetyltransferase family protein [Peptoniphilus asaccharolyticus]
MELYRDGDLVYKVIKQSDSAEVMELVEDIYSRIEDKNTFIRDTKEEMTAENTFLVGVYKNDKIVAYRYMSYSNKEESLAKYVQNLDIPDEPIVIMESVMVHEDARGRGVQNKSRDLLIEHVKEKGFGIMMSTVSPDNEPSFRNVLLSGFQLVELADVHADEEKPEGWTRFIFYKNLNNPLEFTGEEKLVRPKDFETIKNLLKEKFFGVNYRDSYIVFRKLKL